MILLPLVPGTTGMVPCYSTPNTATYDALALCTPLDASSSPFFSFFFLEHPKHGLKFFLGVSFSLQVYSLYTNNVLRRFNHGWSSLVVRRSLQLRRRRKGCHQRFRMECVLVFLLRLLPKGVRPPRPPAVFPENRIMRAFVPKARARALLPPRCLEKKMRTKERRRIVVVLSSIAPFSAAFLDPSIHSKAVARRIFLLCTGVLNHLKKEYFSKGGEFFPFLNPKQGLSKNET